MSRKYIDEAKKQVVVALGVHAPQLPWLVRKGLADYMQRAGSILHTRYEAECSYEWADTDKYRAETENRENKIIKELAKHGLLSCLDFQTDPRGWPLVLTLDGREYRLGGKPS